MDPNEPVDLWALADLCTPWCVHVVVTLRIADHIAAGLFEVCELAQASATNPDALHQVLRHLVSKGVFEERSPGRFALNEAARGLLDPGMRLGFDLGGIGGRMAHAWGSLLSAVRTGESAYHTVFGRPFWDDLDAHPEVAASFDALMGPSGHGIPDPDIALADGWDSVRTVIDVGGGTGSFLAEILRARPDVRGVLVDRPRTIARSTGTFVDAGVADRVTTVGQSFFDPLPAGADIYFLKNVLADWPDRDALVLLRRCAEAARPSGRVVILGGVSPDAEFGPSPELLMLVLVGGKPRTLSQFRELAHQAGLSIRSAGRQSSGRYFVECQPAE